MQVRLVLVALRKHRLSAFLLAMQVCLSCAVFCNASLLIAQRYKAMHLNSGIDESSLAVVKLSGIDPDRVADVNARALDAIRRVPGVTAASVVSEVPFGDSPARGGVTLDAEHHQSAGVIDFYMGDRQAVGALGLHLVAGSLPGPDDYAPITDFVPSNPPVLITRVLAEHFWPGENPLGKRFWGMETSFTVVGVIDHLSVATPGGGEAKDPDWSVFVPTQPGPKLLGTYLLKADPARLGQVTAEAVRATQAAIPDAVVDVDRSATLPELRHRYFESTRVMIGLLFAVIVTLLGTTALGIVGLASFWVAQRKRHVGTRRALGATSQDILRYFQIENALIVAGGVLAGLVLAYVVNQQLMQRYEIPRLPVGYVGLAAVSLLVLGQLAVFVPARRAAAISPMEAVRQG
jgi:putative ABC transport system permease protein